MAGTLNGLFDLTGRVAAVTDGPRGVGSWIAGDEFGASLGLIAREQVATPPNAGRLAYLLVIRKAVATALVGPPAGLIADTACAVTR